MNRHRRGIASSEYHCAEPWGPTHHQMVCCIMVLRADRASTNERAIRHTDDTRICPTSMHMHAQLPLPSPFPHSHRSLCRPLEHGLGTLKWRAQTESMDGCSLKSPFLCRTSLAGRHTAQFNMRMPTICMGRCGPPQWTSLTSAVQQQACHG